MSLGKDLASIRNGIGLSLEEVQSIVKIPVHTLKSIETDGIFDDPEYNQTYTRSFIRSYARALKIDDTLVVEALDNIEAGLYVPGTLLEKLDIQTGKPLIKPGVLDEEENEEQEEESIFKDPDITTAPAKPTPTVENVDWVSLGKSFKSEEARPKIWGAILIVAAIIVIAIVIFIYRVEISGIFSSDDQPEVVDTEETSPALDDGILLPPTETPSNTDNSTTPDEVEAEITSPPAQAIVDETETDEPETPSTPSQNPFASLYSPNLGDTLTISVFAAYDKLEPVRVTSDFNWRTNPFWMEQGQAFNFSFQDTILVRGQYSRMMLLFNGHIIENPSNSYYNEDFDSIMLTRDGLSNGGYLAIPPSTLPEDVVAPDSLVSPLSY